MRQRKPKKIRVEKCETCRKPHLRCTCRKIPNTDEGGRAKSGKKNEQPENGWCVKCRSRVINGLCMNIDCSTRK